MLFLLFIIPTPDSILNEVSRKLNTLKRFEYENTRELDYPSENEEIEIARTTTGDELPELSHLLHAPEIIKFQELVRRVPVPDHIYKYAARLVRRTRPHGGTAPDWR